MWRFQVVDWLYPDCKTRGDVWVYSRHQPPPWSKEMRSCEKVAEASPGVAEALYKSKSTLSGEFPHCVVVNCDTGAIIDIVYLIA